MPDASLRCALLLLLLHQLLLFQLVLPLRGVASKLSPTTCTLCNDRDLAAIAPDGVMNITARVGDRTKLPCTINTWANDYQVVWKDPLDTPLFLNEELLVEEGRFELQRQGNEWNLLISQVAYTDRGRYRCMANTTPMQKTAIDLHVEVPPKIHRGLSSSREVEVTEGASVFLMCNASGVPPPIIRWTRRPADNMVQPPQYLPHVGSELTITNASRYCDDIYQCIASNGVEPSDKHSVNVRVRFSPEVVVRPPRISQLLGMKTTLACHVRMYPVYKVYWTKDDMEIMRENNPRYRPAYEKKGTFVVQASLHIDDIERQDYGEYKCVAINNVGRAEMKAELLESFPLTGLQDVPKSRLETDNDHSIRRLVPTSGAQRIRMADDRGEAEHTESNQSDSPAPDDTRTSGGSHKKPPTRTNGKVEGHGNIPANGHGGSYGNGATNEAKRVTAITGPKQHALAKNTATSLRAKGCCSPSSVAAAYAVVVVACAQGLVANAWMGAIWTA